MATLRSHFPLLFGLIALTACRAQEVELPVLAPTIEITSTAFQSNGDIPQPFTCDGDNRSPDLSWQQLPPETKSVVLIADDPDAPGGTFVHWVLYGLSPQITNLSAGIPAQAEGPDGSLQGKNGFGKLGYRGPCPPSGTHRYFFKLYALSQPVDLPAGTSKNKVLLAIRDYIVATGELMGKYQR